MHRIALLLVSVLLSMSVTASDQSSTETGRTYIKAGRMLDAASGRILSDRVITMSKPWMREGFFKNSDETKKSGSLRKRKPRSTKD